MKTWTIPGAAREVAMARRSAYTAVELGLLHPIVRKGQQVLTVDEVRLAWFIQGLLCIGLTLEQTRPLVAWARSQPPEERDLALREAVIIRHGPSLFAYFRKADEIPADIRPTMVLLGAELGGPR